MRRTSLSVLCGPFLCIAGVALAQNTPSMLSNPWQEGKHWAETMDDLLLIDSGHTKNTGLDTSMFYWDSFGRIRFNRDNSDPSCTMGYRILSIAEDSDSAPINGDYWDIAMSAGYRFAPMGNGWRVSVLGGAGTANDGHFSNTDAIFGIGVVGIGRQLETNSTINLGLSYDGNRSIVPDFPLPFVAYWREVNDQFSYTLGLPASGLDWRPMEMISFKLDYALPVTGTANVSFWFTKTLCIFAEYNSTTDGFFINDQDNRRIFYTMKRVTGGIRWVSKWGDARLGLGYAFDQEFERGYDLRDTHTVNKLSDEPFVSLRVHGTF